MVTTTQHNYISNTSEWSFELLAKYDAQIAKIAKSYQLDTYPIQLEIISSEQMMNAYSYVGMPLGYYHWSFGKQFLNIEKNYKRGRMDLAYELVINSNPCIAYLMEENTMAMQALVIAHACYGHNSFFKNNYLFKIWTNASSIIDYLLFAKNYIAECEEKHGIDAVEEIIDACHALMNHGVDRYKHPLKLSIEKERIRQKKREDYLQSQINLLWRTLPERKEKALKKGQKKFPTEPHENILYFIEKHSPLLKPWQREIIRIIRKTAQYFYPQRQTKVMNEGWATFWHYTIMNKLFDDGLISESFLFEILQSHTNVILQQPFDSPFYSGINPYTLGFKMFSDIRRICENPSKEDEKYFPDIAHSDWNETLLFAMENFKDESFIAQYLSPNVIRDMKLFSIVDDDNKDVLEVSAIHNNEGYQHVRNSLSNQYNLSIIEPNIQVYQVDVSGDRSLTLRHTQHDRLPLEKHDMHEVVKHAHRLWGFPVRLELIDEKGQVRLLDECPAKTSLV